MAVDFDPRVYFAAERTLLAWVRTGLTVIGLGFVVARFNLFLRMIHHDHDDGPQHVATLIGICLVILGSVSIALAAWQHTQFTRQLGTRDLPHAYLVRWSVWFAVCISTIGAFLAIFIAMQSTTG